MSGKKERPNPYCSAKSPSGFYCVLLVGHAGPHLSIDNSRLWEGTPGAPLLWHAASPPPAPSDPVAPPVPRAPAIPEVPEIKAPPMALDISSTFDQARAKGYTGIPCGGCGSLNTVRVGSCLRCESCGSAGECG